MKKILFTLYMTLLFSFLAIAQPTGRQRLATTHVAIRAITNPSISHRETRRLRSQTRRVVRVERLARVDGIVTPRERRVMRRSNRHLRRSIRRERLD